MWQIENLTPFAEAGSWVRDHEGAEVRLVAVKCTFDIHADGTTTVSADQPPPVHVAEYFGQSGKSSIRYEADLSLAKLTTDVTVVGHAYAPGGRPVTELEVGLRVGP